MLQASNGNVGPGKKIQALKGFSRKETQSVKAAKRHTAAIAWKFIFVVAVVCAKKASAICERDGVKQVTIWMMSEERNTTHKSSSGS